MNVECSKRMTFREHTIRLNHLRRKKNYKEFTVIEIVIKNCKQLK